GPNGSGSQTIRGRDGSAVCVCGTAGAACRSLVCAWEDRGLLAVAACIAPHPAPGTKIASTSEPHAILRRRSLTAQGALSVGMPARTPLAIINIQTNGYTEASPMISKLDFVAVPSQDAERSRRFYAETLGLRPDAHAQFEFWAGETCLGIWEPGQFGMDFAPQKNAHLALHVDDVANARAE